MKFVLALLAVVAATRYPTRFPTGFPTSSTRYPTAFPTGYPTTGYPTAFPTAFPTTRYPTGYPTTGYPTAFPTAFPTGYPTTRYPTRFPTGFPTTPYPTGYPTTGYPTHFPTAFPTHFPTAYPTRFPTHYPTPFPTAYPTHFPTAYPTRFPTAYPTRFPTSFPTPAPTSNPTSFNGVHEELLHLRNTAGSVWGKIGVSSMGFHVSASKCVDRSNLCGTFGSMNWQAASTECKTSASAKVISSARLVYSNMPSTHINLYSDGTLTFESTTCVKIEQSATSADIANADCLTKISFGSDGNPDGHICMDSAGGVTMRAKSTITL